MSLMRLDGGGCCDVWRLGVCRSSECCYSPIRASVRGLRDGWLLINFMFDLF